MDCEELLRTAAAMYDAAKKEKAAGRLENAAIARNVGLGFECMFYGFYAMEYAHGIKMCED